MVLMGVLGYPLHDTDGCVARVLRNPLHGADGCVTRVLGYPPAMVLMVVLSVC